MLVDILNKADMEKNEMKKMVKFGFEQMNESYKICREMLESIMNEIKFIDTRDIGGDTIYGYDTIDDEACEMPILGIRNNDGNIEVYFRPCRYSKEWDWSEHENDNYDSFASDESEGYWESLFGGEVLCVFTLYNIFECLKQYI